jgi:ATP-dependent Lon protease
MLSALAQRAPKPWVAMTGEITLRGRVLEVGAIKEKVLAAHRAGVKTVILPEDNRKDLVDVPKEIQEDLTFVFASRFSEVLDACFDPPIGKTGGKKPASRSRAAAPKRPARKRPPQRR